MIGYFQEYDSLCQNVIGNFRHVCVRKFYSSVSGAQNHWIRGKLLCDTCGWPNFSANAPHAYMFQWVMLNFPTLPTHVRQGWGSHAGKGGAIFNAGHVVIKSTSSFAGNTAAVSAPEHSVCSSLANAEPCLVSCSNVYTR